MGKMKFYAIQTPSVKKIVTSWPECERLVHGVKGCLYKSFATRADAEAWLSGVSEKHADGLRIYVDGSYSPDFDYAGWAFIAVENGREVGSESGITEFPAESRNIDGEFAASLHAMAWLKKTGKTGVICHDYEGIARFAKGEWKATKPIAIRYRDAAKAFPGTKFEKVPAHSGVKWNEAVDELAKKAIVNAKKGIANAKKGVLPGDSPNSLQSGREEPSTPKSTTPPHGEQLELF